MKNTLLKKLLIVFISLNLFTSNSSFSKLENDTISKPNNCTLYDELQLQNLGLSETVFNKAIRGLQKLSENNCVENCNIISIADLSQSSNCKRLYVINIVTKTVLYNTYVAHGRNSGEEFACKFSNITNSFQSSLGFYTTSTTYNGEHGLSMRLIGIEKGINDNAELRGIVMHAADYVCENFITQNGRLGRSHGCPAVSPELCTPIINSIKEGSCFYVFNPDNDYVSKSVY